jgi:type I site-specific restriction endonuclease
MATNEAFSRVKIDAQLKDQGWDVLDTNAVRFEYALPDKTKADYVLCDRHGRALAVISDNPVHKSERLYGEDANALIVCGRVLGAWSLRKL